MGPGWPLEPGARLFSLHKPSGNQLVDSDCKTTVLSQRMLGSRAGGKVAVCDVCVCVLQTGGGETTDDYKAINSRLSEHDCTLTEIQVLSGDTQCSFPCVVTSLWNCAVYAQTPRMFSMTKRRLQASEHTHPSVLEMPWTWQHTKHDSTQTQHISGKRHESINKWVISGGRGMDSSLFMRNIDCVTRSADSPLFWGLPVCFSSAAGAIKTPEREILLLSS